ncbi:hypothetical protein [Nocardia sp. NPDC058633]|uniref:hypothetical protein n=1 Tax=Nocardia sp. NPDC058633 TaxID=3346568 RepID=UPI00364EBB0A
MHTVDLLTVGRGEEVVASAIAYLEPLGFRVLGTTSDDEARAILHREQVRLLVIGGGVEADSRNALTAEATQRGTTVVQAQRAGRDLEQYLGEEIVPILEGAASHRVD